MHKQKFLSKAINGIGLAIAFNQEISSGLSDFTNGTWMNDPQSALGHLQTAAIGVNPNGTINHTALTASVTSKVAGYAWVKFAHFVAKRMRI